MFRFPLLLVLILVSAPDSEKPREPTARSFTFTYETTVTGLKPGQTAKIWIPVASSSEDQKVEVIERQLPKLFEKCSSNQEPRYGNKILFVVARADDQGKIPLKLVYKVTRKEVRGDKSSPKEENAAQIKRFLQADALVPVGGKSLELLKGRELPRDQTAAARVLYDVVNNHMRYSKEGTGWGRGDVKWVCDSKYGNCTDFHSLFLSMIRAQKIPAKFEMGFSLPAGQGKGTITGYHCWAKFKPEGKGWIPVDISEANKQPAMKDYYFGNLTPDRIAFTTGRDIDLVPRQADGPLNYFIYPHVEVDGKEYPSAKIVYAFSYQDTSAPK